MGSSGGPRRLVVWHIALSKWRRYSGLFHNLPKSIAHCLQFIFWKSEFLKNGVHATESSAQKLNNFGAIDFDDTFAREVGATDATCKQLDAAVDLSEKIGPIRPMFV